MFDVHREAKRRRLFRFRQRLDFLMAHLLRLDDHVALGDDTYFRILEIRADTVSERDHLVAIAERKGWSLWMQQSEPGSDARWGAVLEKGMPPRPDFDALLLMEALQTDPR